MSGLGNGRGEIRAVSLIYTIPQGLEDAAVAVNGGGNGVEGETDAGAVAGSGGAGAGAEEGYGNRKMNMLMLEFNSFAWAGDTGKLLCAGGCAAAS